VTNAYIVTGTLTDEKTVHLDEPLPVSAGRVRVIVEQSPAPRQKQSWQDYFAGLRSRQLARGHIPRSAADIEAQMREERDSWDD
jgi:hypothetical protein